MTDSAPWMHPPGPIRLAVSSCLLGERVRWDGNHKRDGFVVETLGSWFALVPVCPEVAVGLGVPRPPLRLEGDPAAPRAVCPADATVQPTAALGAYGRRMARELGDIAGYVLKSGSPSCGMERVRVYGRAGPPSRKGRGPYAAALLAARPELPVEEEGRLNDPGLRDNFIERVLANHRWQALRAAGLTPARLVEFHNRHKLALMAHGVEPARSLGRIVARAGTTPRARLAAEYGGAFMALLRRKATARLHTNVLHHLMGYLKTHLDGADKAELLEAIEAYRQGATPRLAPLTLLRHHFRRHPHPYVQGQTYLEPHPAEWMVRGGR